MNTIFGSRISVGQLKSVLTVVCSLLAMSVVWVPAAQGDATPSADQIVQQVLPGATVSLSTPSATTEASRLAQHHKTPFSAESSAPAVSPELVIQLPPNAIPATDSQVDSSFVYDELGWRARLAAGAISALQPLSGYQVRTASGATPDASANQFSGSLTNVLSPATDQNLDTVNSSVAMAQMESNLKVLKGVLPAGSVTASSVNLIPVGSGDDEYAIEANITIADASDLDGHYGDATAGMETGLLSQMSQSPFEGVAVNVTTPDGTPVVSEWSSTRTQEGSIAFGDPGAAPTTMSVTTTFPDVTGIPATTSVAVGGAAILPSTGDPGYTQAHGTAAPTAPVLGAAPLGHSVAHLPWWAMTLLALAVLSLPFLGLRFRSRRRPRLGSPRS